MTSNAVFICCIATSLGQGVSTSDIDSYIGEVVRVNNSCGPTAAYYCLARLGYAVQLKDMWNEVTVHDDGVSIQEVLELLRRHGLAARAEAFAKQDLEEIPIPAILIINESHCVVYDGATGDKSEVRCFEPATGEVVKMKRSDLIKGWSGQAIIFQAPLISWTRFGITSTLFAVGLYVVVLATRRIVRAYRIGVGHERH